MKSLRTFSAIGFIALVSLTHLACSGAAEDLKQLRDPDGKPADMNQPVQVYILLGQSNMLGFGRVHPAQGDPEGSLAHAVKEKLLYPYLVDDAGDWTVRKDVRNVRVMGSGTGATRVVNNEWLTITNKAIGPEIGIGHYLGDAVEAPVLLLKSCIGNRALGWDLLPPGSDGFEFTDAEGVAWIHPGYRGSPERWLKGTEPKPINWYAGMQYDGDVARAKQVLAEIDKYYPGATEYEIAGFFWWQGDRDSRSAALSSRYEKNLVQLIKQLRKDFDAPRAKFVCATLGQTQKGAEDNGGKILDAMFAVDGESGKYPEFNGVAATVYSHPLSKGGSSGGHYGGNAETYMNVGEAMGRAMVGLLQADVAPETKAIATKKPWQMSGYLLVPNERVPEDYGGGFSMYVAAWPLLTQYPGSKFQTGLFGTWMHPRYERKPSERLYTDIEGGLGWWRDTRFATEMPKFIMGGVALDFSMWANGPGAGKGRDWEKPNGKYAVVQLSRSILWPPDGLNLRQGTCGEFFGYGYLPLPLTDSKATTAGAAVPTGDQCWTLFVNAGNYKGPVTFFAPYFWSRASIERPELAEMFLDVRPSDPNRALQMETQYVPAAQAADAEGNCFARVAPTLFPINADGETIVVHKVTSYRKAALWDEVERWFAGGEPASGAIDPAESIVHKFTGRGGATWRIYEQGSEREDRIPLDWSSFATPTSFGDDAFGYRWNQELVAQRQVASKQCVTLPEYYRLASEPGGGNQWQAVTESDVPEGLRRQGMPLEQPGRRPQEPYVTPTEPDSSWKKPGPAAGPFKAYPGDGSEVTYYWYRFADQPALLNADLTAEEREALQTRVEMIHRTWSHDRDYLPPPRIGRLADIDPQLIVTPPQGLKVGYVPIVTRQRVQE